MTTTLTHDLNKPHIFLVEDNPGDAQLVTEALSIIDAEIDVDWASDGEEDQRKLPAMDAQGHLPDLIILNYNLPKMTGSEIFKWLRSQPSLARISTIMLTSLDRDSDRAARAGVEDYLIKGPTWADTLGIARRIVSLLRHFTENEGQSPMSIPLANRVNRSARTST